MPNSLPEEINLINEKIFQLCNLSLSNVIEEKESQDYLAHTFNLDDLKIIFRSAKITPKKIGQFVTIWKRNKSGITAPFSINDDFEFFIIAIKNDVDFGIFIFPKKVLHENKILSDASKDGKRGIRVYAPWDLPTSKQALKTKNWQNTYFLKIENSGNNDIIKARKLIFQNF